MCTLLTESLPVNVLELQPSFLFKEWQISPIYSHKQPSRSILWNNCSKTFHKILRKASVVDSFSLLKLNIYIYIYTPTNYLFRNFSNFWEHFCFFENTFRRLLPWNKKPLRSSCLKELLEIAVLKYLRRLPGNYPW